MGGAAAEDTAGESSRSLGATKAGQSAPSPVWSALVPGACRWSHPDTGLLDGACGFQKAGMGLAFLRLPPWAADRFMTSVISRNSSEVIGNHAAMISPPPATIGAGGKSWAANGEVMTTERHWPCRNVMIGRLGPWNTVANSPWDPTLAQPAFSRLPPETAGGRRLPATSRKSSEVVGNRAGTTSPRRL